MGLQPCSEGEELLKNKHNKKSCHENKEEAGGFFVFCFFYYKHMPGLFYSGAVIYLFLVFTF